MNLVLPQRRMNVNRVTLSAFGTTGVLLAASLTMLAVVSALVTFDAWPTRNGGAIASEVAVHRAPAARLVRAVLHAGTGTTGSAASSGGGLAATTAGGAGGGAGAVALAARGGPGATAGGGPGAYAGPSVPVGPAPRVPVNPPGEDLGPPQEPSEVVHST